MLTHICRRSVLVGLAMPYLAIRLRRGRHSDFGATLSNCFHPRSWMRKEPPGISTTSPGG